MGERRSKVSIYILSKIVTSLPSAVRLVCGSQDESWRIFVAASESMFVSLFATTFRQLTRDFLPA